MRGTALGCRSPSRPSYRCRTACRRTRGGGARVSFRQQTCGRGPRRPRRAVTHRPAVLGPRARMLGRRPQGHLRETMDDATVSIAIPVYNGGHYLAGGHRVGPVADPAARRGPGVRQLLDRRLTGGRGRRDRRRARRPERLQPRRGGQLQPCRGGLDRHLLRLAGGRRPARAPLRRAGPGGAARAPRSAGLPDRRPVHRPRRPLARRAARSRAVLDQRPDPPARRTCAGRAGPRSTASTGATCC